MPTEKPRITVTLEKKHYALLLRVSEQQGKSMSAIISGLVGAVAPSYERVAVLMDRASRANSDVLEGVVGAVERAEEVVLDLLGPSTQQMNLFERAREKALHGALCRESKTTGSGGKAGGSAGARSRSLSISPPGRASADPRPVITGVRSAKTSTPRASKRAKS